MLHYIHIWIIPHLPDINILRIKKKPLTSILYIMHLYKSSNIYIILYIIYITSSIYDDFMPATLQILVKGLIALLTVHLALSGRTRMSKHLPKLKKISSFKRDMK